MISNLSCFLIGIGGAILTVLFCVFACAFVNPVFGWAFTMLLDNLGLTGDKERAKELSRKKINYSLSNVYCMCIFISLSKIIS
ncbi:MAG: DUF3360 family protein [Lutibacter sp.]|nr:DUF3360 family protein [Lutibacter sp.]